MPSEIMDQRMLPPTSYFAEEIHFPAERQVGFWNPETRRDHKGVGTVGMSQALESQSIKSSSLEKYETVGAVTHPMECMELIQPCPIRDQSSKLNLEHPVVGAEKMTDQSMTSWRSIGYSLGTKTNVFVQPATCFVDSNKVDMGPQYENCLFPSSLSEIFRRKLRLPSNDVLFGHSVDAVTSQLEEEDPFETFEDIEAHTIGNLLPDDDDLLSNAIYDMECIAQPTNSDGLEDLDLFSSGGGMELEGDDSLSSSEAQGILDFARATSNGQLQGLNRSSAGKHPYGEHPSRTLFVRNINSNIEDSELRVLFEQYGDIRTLYTACKHRGFVMISYYDIRAASNAMKALQNRLLRRRKLDIHFSIPKDNPSEKDINQGTLVVFNLDLSVSNDELRRIFGVYGEIKEIREALHKHRHKFLEFYDVRDAEAALNALNRSDIAGKRIKLELSNFAYTRRLMQQVSANLDQEESSVCLQQGSPPTQSSLGCFGPVSHGVVMSSCMENGAAQGLNSAMRIPINPFVENEHHCEPSPSAPKNLSSLKVSTIGNQFGLAEPSQTMGQVEFGLQKMPMFHPHSLPHQYHHGLVNAVPFNSACAMGANICLKPSEGINNRHIGGVDSNGHSIELNGDDFGSGNGTYPLHGHEYIWRNSSSYLPHHHLPSTSMWPNSPSIVNGVHGHHSPQLHGLPRVSSHTLNPVLPIRHHPVGSAPAVNSSLWNRRHAYVGESHESSCFLPVSLGSKGFSRSLTPHLLELASHNIYPHVSGNFLDPSHASTYVGLQSPQQRCHMFPDRNSSTPLSNSYDGPNERFRSRRNEVSANQADNKKQYELDINRIVCGEDTRTTLMIKNIPNKYTSKMLLAAIDEHHRGTYDFVYLPIDFKNKCNVGYAFINMLNPLHIIPFYQTFNGKKWEKFNSEKVASLAYARIQGKAALVAHFQNSSLMNEDKRCRPILFHSDGPNAGDQEPFPMGINIQTRPNKPRSNGSEENHEGSPSISNQEESSNGVESLSGSSKG